MRPPDQTRAEKKRAQIRDAAQVLFLRAGFQGTSTDAIAAAAGVSKETLYRHYASKEDLFVDVMRSLIAEHVHLAQWTERFAQPANRQDLRMILRDIAHEALAAMAQPEYLAFFRLMLAELPRFPELGPLFRQNVPEPVHNTLLTLLRQGQARGVIRQHLDLPLIARMFFSTLLSYGVLDGLLANAHTPHLPDEGVVERFVEQILEMISVQHNS